MSLLFVGTVAFDDIETPYQKVGKVVGGAALYGSLSASFFINSVKLVSVIGDDYDQETLDLLKIRHINTEGLQVIDGGKSFFWSGRYHKNMISRETLDTQLNVLADFDPVLPKSYQHTDYVMLGNLTPKVQMRVIEQLENKPKLIALDTMNFWMDIAMDDLKEVLKKIDMLIINDEEARQLSGEHSLMKAYHVIEKMGPKYLIIKKGEHGALLFGEGHTFFAPAIPLEEVVDPTGAGDTFAGGLMGYLAGSDDVSFDNIKKGVIVGSAMASFCVEEFSIKGFLELDKKKIQERVQVFERLTRFDAVL